MSEMTERELFDFLKSDYEHPFNGWDFSYLKGRRVTIRTELQWDYVGRVVEAMKGAQKMLDMHTGGGEVLSGLLEQQAVPEVYATELYAPNVVVARQRLEPLGVRVYEAPDETLPFADGELDLVTNRHASYDAREALRIVKQGGLFITQQVGEQTNRRLHELLGREKMLERPENMEYGARELEEAGWEVVERKEEFIMTRFYDVGAIVYYLKAVPWEVPDFAVERYWERLAEVHRLIQKEGYVEVAFHMFFLVGRRP